MSSLKYLNPGFDVRKMVNSCEDGFPLVLISKVAMGRAICGERGGEYEPANVVIPLIGCHPIP